MGVYINNKSKAQELADLSVNVGKYLLASGAEVYRVEDTVYRMCYSCKGIKQIDVFATSNIVMLSFLHFNENIIAMKRVKTKDTNLKRVELINSFSRRFVSEEISIEEGIKETNRILEDSKPNINLEFLGGGISAAAFCLMTGGSVIEGLLAFIASFIALYFGKVVGKYHYSFFIKIAFSSFIMAFIAFTVSIIGIKIDPNNVVVGAIMPLLPGGAITNAVRDLMSGDVLSGLSGLSDAVLTAAGIAIGVGGALYLFIFGGWI